MRAIRRIGEFLDYQIDCLLERQLVDYFTDLLVSHYWSEMKLDQFVTTYIFSDTDFIADVAGEAAINHCMLLLCTTYTVALHLQQFATQALEM